jgi:hypothetical protein
MTYTNITITLGRSCDVPKNPTLWDTTRGASQLHDHRLAVIELFRGGVSLEAA